MARFKGQPFINEVGNEFFNQGMNRTSNYNDWLYDLKQLYMSIFEWGGITDPVDVNVVERWLLERGSVAFFIDSEVGPLILPYVINGGLDPYGNPSGIRAYGVNGYSCELPRGSYVLIFDNRLKVSALPMLMDYARRLANIDNTITINLNSQKTPFVLTATTDAELASLKAGYNAIQNGSPVLAQVGSTMTGGITAFKTQADAVFLQMQALKESILNECLSRIGIPNRGRPKSAQVNNEEISAMNGQVVHERNDRWLPRSEAVELINSRFAEYGISLTCDFAKQLYNYGIADTMISTPEDRK